MNTTKTITTLLLVFLLTHNSSAYLRIGRVYKPGKMLSTDDGMLFSRSRVRRDVANALVKAKDDLQNIKAALRLKNELNIHRSRKAINKSI